MLSFLACALSYTLFASPASLPASRRPALVSRSAPPLSFEADLSEPELRGVLGLRGIASEDLIESDKGELISRLQASSPSSSTADPALSFSEAEAKRVATFEQVSPSVAFIQ